MKLLMLGAMLGMLTGCAYNETFILAHGDVYCTSSVDKPVSVVPSVDLKARDVTVPMIP